MIKVTVSNVQAAKDAIQQELKKFMTDKFVTVGVHQAAGNVESGDITMAGLGAVHEFGADIDHPGGTSYGYATEADAQAGRVKFLKTGSGFMELGKTGAHKIKIPARPWLIPGAASGNAQYLKILSVELEKGSTPDEALNKIGVVAVAKTQQYMRDLKLPPNAPSTIAKKGSSNPLIDSGALLQSVTYTIQNGKPDEGLE